jgi:hypothetical protein
MQKSKIKLTIAVALADISYLDFPELKFNKYESTQMPFRYVKGENGEPIMPEVSAKPDAARLIHTHKGKLTGNEGLD